MQRGTNLRLTAVLALAQLTSGQDPNGRLLAFDPLKHGFNFVNQWDGDLLVDVPVLGRFDLGQTSYGLCGGMSMAAMDSFLVDAEIPDFAGAPDSPPSGSDMRSYVYGRQQDTFRADNGFMIRRLVGWIVKPIKTNVLGTGLHVLTDRQFKRIVAPQIDAGRPVNLCLVRNEATDFIPSSLLQLTANGFQKNHQVLAIGYRLCPKTAGLKAHWTVDVYDPNYPDRIMSLHYSDRGRAQTPRTDTQGQPIDDPHTYDDPAGQQEYPSFRAFFAVPYTHQTPPWVDAATMTPVEPTESPMVTDPDLTVEEPDDPDPVLEEADRRAIEGEAGSAVDPQLLARMEAFDKRLAAIEARLPASEGTPGQDPAVTDTADKAETDVASADSGLSQEQLEAMRRDPRFVGGVLVDAAIERVLDAELKGRTGRLLLTYPKDTKVNDDVAIFTSGEVEKYLTWGKGAFAAELIPGRYAVVVNKTRIEDIEVKSRNESRVLMSVLRLNVGARTDWALYVPGGTAYAIWGHGPQDVGLVPGDYEIEINKQREKVSVRAGEVTEY